MNVFDQGMRTLESALMERGQRKYYWILGTPARTEMFTAGTVISSYRVPPDSTWNRLKSAIIRLFRRAVPDMSFCGYPAYWMPRLVDREVFLMDGKRIAGRFTVEDRSAA